MFTYSLQFYLKEQNKVITLNDTTNIYYSGNIVIYERPYRYTTDNGSFGPGHEQSPTVKTCTKYRYLIFHQKAKTGIWFDSLNMDHPKIIGLDSFRIAHMFKRFDFADLRFETLVSSKKNNRGFTEMYTAVNKPDNSYFDTLYYHYTRSADFRYFLSPSLDRIKKSTLTKATLIYKKNYDQDLKITVPRRIFEFELTTKETPLRIDSVLRIFKRLSDETVTEKL